MKEIVVLLWLLWERLQQYKSFSFEMDSGVVVVDMATIIKIEIRYFIYEQRYISL